MSVTIVFVGIDLAKSVFALHGVDEVGKRALARAIGCRSLSSRRICHRVMPAFTPPRASFIRVSGMKSRIKDRL